MKNWSSDTPILNIMSIREVIKTIELYVLVDSDGEDIGAGDDNGDQTNKKKKNKKNHFTTF